MAELLAIVAELEKNKADMAARLDRIQAAVDVAVELLTNAPPSPEVTEAIARLTSLAAAQDAQEAQADATAAQLEAAETPNEG